MEKAPLFSKKSLLDIIILYLDMGYGGCPIEVGTIN